MSEQTALRALELAVTSRCNLACKHCYQKNDKPAEYTLTAKLIQQALMDAVDCGASTAILTGGEFFVHPQWREILQIIHTLGIKSHISTNGTLLTDDICEVLGLVGVEVVGISIDGFREDHDWRRGKGTFNKAIQSVKRLNNLGLNVKASITIDRRNIRYLDELTTYLEQVGVKDIVLINIAAAGCALDNLQDLMLCPQDWDTLRTLYRQGAKPRDKPCPIFASMLSVSYDGTVYPCTMAMTMKLFPLGNIYNNALKDIWENAYAQRYPFQTFQLTDLKECISCEAFHECGGCCRVRAAKYYGNFLAPDPFACFVYRGNVDGDIANLMYGTHT